MMKILWRCLQGPRLLRLYLSGVVDYAPNGFERWSDTVLTSLACAASLAMYTSPLVLPWTYKRGWFTEDGAIWVAKFMTGLGVVAVGALVIRTLGRMSNPTYTKFLSVLSEATSSYTEANKRLLEEYDFNFRAWPVDFDVRQIEGDGSKPRRYLPDAPVFSLLGAPSDLLAWLLTHSFGLSLVYPGSMLLMQTLIERQLLEGRTKLVLENKGRRNKVVTMDDNEIDTIYIEQKDKANGRTLVICCEGNGGFYEIGFVSTPISAGYSVLGWNHPGFAGSSGRPFPRQEANAVDAVMQFAIHKLGYLPEQILVYGWSIGGYSATWIAMNYPDIKGLILDATFDDILPLAIPRMPQSLSSVVTKAIRSYINLDVSSQLAGYEGPVRFIRRSRDEMITTMDGELWSNRGNNLMKSLLKSRYPDLITPTSLSALDGNLYVLGATAVAAADQESELLFSQMIGRDQELSEEEKGKVLCYIASKMLTEIDTTHCTPLPTSKFQLPWDPAIDAIFIELPPSKDQ